MSVNAKICKQEVYGAITLWDNRVYPIVLTDQRIGSSTSIRECLIFSILFRTSFFLSRTKKKRLFGALFGKSFLLLIFQAVVSWMEGHPFLPSTLRPGILLDRAMESILLLAFCTFETGFDLYLTNLIFILYIIKIIRVQS